MDNLPDGLTMIARIKARDNEGDPLEVDLEIEDHYLMLTFDSDCSCSA